MRVGVLCVAWFVCGVAGADGDVARDRKLYDQADAELTRAAQDYAKATETFAKRLEAALASDNAFSRQLALQRLRAEPTLARAETLKPLFGVLDDREPHPIGDCARKLETLRGTMAQGLDQEWHRCGNNRQSNAAFAQEVLALLAKQGTNTVRAQLFVANIYQQYLGKDSRGVALDNAATVRRYFAEPLASALLADRKAAAKRKEVPQLDGDPFIDAQDWDIATYDVMVTETEASRRRAEVKFNNAGRNDVIVLDLVADRDFAWRIAEIHYAKTTLSKIVAGAKAR